MTRLVVKVVILKIFIWLLSVKSLSITEGSKSVLIEPMDTGGFRMFEGPGQK